MAPPEPSRLFEGTPGLTPINPVGVIKGLGAMGIREDNIDPVEEAIGKELAPLEVVELMFIAFAKGRRVVKPTGCFRFNDIYNQDLLLLNYY